MATDNAQSRDRVSELLLADRAAEWRRLKALVLDSVSSPITRRVYNLAGAGAPLLRRTR